MQDILVDFRVQRFFLASERELLHNWRLTLDRQRTAGYPVTAECGNGDFIFLLLHDLGEYKALYFHVFWRFVFLHFPKYYFH